MVVVATRVRGVSGNGVPSGKTPQPLRMWVASKTVLATQAGRIPGATHENYNKIQQELQQGDSNEKTKENDCTKQDEADGADED